MEKTKIICKQCGKVTINAGQGLCKKHYEQLHMYGKFLDSNPRTKYDPNEYNIKDGFVEVYTYNNKNEVDYTFKIDVEYLPLIIQYKWNHTKPKKTKEGEIVYMSNKELGMFHRYIMGNPRGTVDHINRDTTDNRTNNLRVASYSEQNLNRVYKSNRCDIRGIDIHKDSNRTKRYMARFNYKGKSYRSMWFYTYEEAVYARYLLEQLSPIKIVNNNMSVYINNLTEEQKAPILKWFKNRFKNRV